jgi:hypothetical protein
LKTIPFKIKIHINFTAEKNSLKNVEKVFNESPKSKQSPNGRNLAQSGHTGSNLLSEVVDPGLVVLEGGLPDQLESGRHLHPEDGPALLEPRNIVKNVLVSFSLQSFTLGSFTLRSFAFIRLYFDNIFGQYLYL